MRHLRFVCAVGLLLGMVGAGASSCGGGSSPQEDFCQSWASAFCKKLYACTDPSGPYFLGGSSEAQCTQGWAATCIQPQQNGQTFDVNCSGGVHVNTAAKSACMTELSTITCDEFNSPDYTSVCTQVCGGSQSGGTGGSGTGGSGTGGSGTGGTGTGGTGTGGSGGATACGTVEPCGGDLVGNWSLTTACEDAGELRLAVQQSYYCPQATVASSSVVVTGTVTFNSNMTYSITENITQMMTVDVPASCAQGVDCATYGTYLALFQPPSTSISCSGTTTCVCLQSSADSGTDTGTYVLSGGNATITSATTGSSSTNGYCVQGSTIHLITVDPTMSTGPNNQATIQSDIVGKKQ